MTEAIGALTAEQHNILQKAAKSTPSLSRLHQRLVVMERYIIALSRKGAVLSQSSEIPDGTGKDEIEASEKDEGVKPVKVKFEPLIEKKSM